MHLRAVLMAMGAAVLACGLAFAEPVKVAAEKLPPAVWKTMQAQSGGKQPGGITRDDSGGEVTYEATFAEGSNEERSITVAENGALVGMDVTLAETPAAVQKTIAAQLGSGRLDNIEKSMEDGETSYDVDFTTKAGVERSFSVADNGALLSIEMPLEETPTAVQAAIKAQVTDGKVSQIEKTFDEGATAYEVGFTNKAGGRSSFSVAENGQLQSMEIPLAQATPAAQKTITNRIGSGRILRVSAAFGEKLKVTAYEVEGTVNGKAMDFRVGLKGKFLENLD